MAVSFNLENRTNRDGECPIRVSWSFGKSRYQTTLGFSIKAENWDTENKEVKADARNSDDVNADDINHYIRRIRTVVHRIEGYYKARKRPFTVKHMRDVINDVKSSRFHSDSELFESYTSNMASTDDERIRYYRSYVGEYYIYVCNAFDRYIGEEFYILQEMFGSTKKIIVPVREFQKVKDHSRWASAKFEEVSEDEALGRIPRK